jgi:predicted O-methyltransferase YrrM
MSFHSSGTVDSIEINKEYSEIATKIHEHAGIKTIKFHIGTVLDNKQFLVDHGPFDLVFIDH